MKHPLTRLLLLTLGSVVALGASISRQDTLSLTENADIVLPEGLKEGSVEKSQEKKKVEIHIYKNIFESSNDQRLEFDQSMLDDVDEQLYLSDEERQVLENFIVQQDYEAAQDFLNKKLQEFAIELIIIVHESQKTLAGNVEKSIEEFGFEEQFFPPGLTEEITVDGAEEFLHSDDFVITVDGQEFTFNIPPPLPESERGEFSVWSIPISLDGAVITIDPERKESPALEDKVRSWVEAIQKDANRAGKTASP